MPSCQCHSWTWNLMPCKHMFAVITLKLASWQSLPQSYRDSPFFTLDKDIQGFIQANEKIYEYEQPDEDLTEHDDVQELDLDKLPPSKKSTSNLKRAAVKCREKLSVLRDATYQCQDVEALEQMANILDQAAKHIKNHMYIEDGLVKESKSEPPQNKRKLQNLSNIKTSKQATSGRRVGKAAENEFQSKKPTQPVGDICIIEDGYMEVPEHTGRSIFKYNFIRI